MDIEELEVTLKMLDVNTSHFNSIAGKKGLFIQIVDLSLKGFILDLLEQNNFQYHMNDYTPIHCDIYIEIEEIKNEYR